ncbi:tripartite tricarboxylate transporter TctB family protein [Acetobacteraceae bacterium H6797]|nr:tripartite tricarboxylate transporter TctB family protein [Acetobacteraceae bacterium H6797]
MQDGEGKLLSRFGLELVGALFVMGFGLTVVLGALEHPVGWAEDGPQAGTLPFWLGAIVMATGAFIMLQAVRARRGLTLETVLDKASALRVARFGIPIIVFVALIMPLGIYVAMALYLAAMLIWQGHGWKAALFTAIAAVAFSFVAFEYWFALPLPKGPIEAFFGIY